MVKLLKVSSASAKTSGSARMGVTLLKSATAGLAFSSPRLGRTATISLALVAGAGAHTCGGTFERIPL
jgi:hypothetical protein